MDRPSVSVCLVSRPVRESEPEGEGVVSRSPVLCDSVASRVFTLAEYY